jgi:hypothetical protein
VALIAGGVEDDVALASFEWPPSKCLAHCVLMGEASDWEDGMDTLHDRLAELAEDAPRGGVAAAELWARGKRAHRVRVAAVATSVLVVSVVGTGIGVRLVDGDGNRAHPLPAATSGVRLPIEYPVGKALPDLGETPGPLTAVWLVPRVGGGRPTAVGLVAQTGTFGTLPIELPAEPGDPGNPDPLTRVRVSLSPDGRRIAYPGGPGAVGAREPADVIVHDLVTGQEDANAITGVRLGVGAWIDATHHLGYYSKDGGVNDANGWVWEPGSAPRLVQHYSYVGAFSRPYLGSAFIGAPYKDNGLEVNISGDGPYSCSPPTLRNERPASGRPGRVQVPVLCDVLYIGNEFVLGHWKDQPDHNRTVVALDVRHIRIPAFGSEPAQPDTQFDDPALRRVVVAAGAPEHVSLAADLVGGALKTQRGAS